MLDKINLLKIYGYYQQIGSSFENVRALATFHIEETRLFEDSVRGFQEKYPDQQYVDHLALGVLLPVLNSIEFLETKIPSLKALATSKRNAFVELRRSLGQYPLELRKLGFPLLEQEETNAKELEDLIQKTQTGLEKFLSFTQKVFVDIMQKTSNRGIITAQDYAMQDINVRNEIYRNALNNEKSLLGYNVKSTVNAGLLVTRLNTVRWQMYEELDEEKKALLHKHIFTGIFPEPLGVDQISGKTVFENIFADAAKNLQRNEELCNVVEEYFRQRVNQVYSAVLHNSL